MRCILSLIIERDKLADTGFHPQVPYSAGMSFTSRIRVYYYSTLWAVANEWIQALFSLASVALFVGDTYISSYSQAVFCFEVVFSVYFLCNWILELTIARGTFAQLFSVLSLLDLITIIPVLVMVVTREYSTNPAGYLRLCRVLNVSRVFRPFRVLRITSNKLSAGEDAVRTQTFRLGGFFLSMLLMATGTVQLLAEGDAIDWGVTDFQTGKLRVSVFFQTFQN